MLWIAGLLGLLAAGSVAFIGDDMAADEEQSDPPLAGEPEDGAAPINVDALPPILEELRGLDERKAEIVQLRVFWGMTVPEVAELLEISQSTVDRDWRFAHRWLANRLRPPKPEPGASRES